MKDAELWDLDMREALRAKRESCMHKNVGSNSYNENLTCYDCDAIIPDTEIMAKLITRVNELEDKVERLEKQAYDP